MKKFIVAVILALVSLHEAQATPSHREPDKTHESRSACS